MSDVAECESFFNYTMFFKGLIFLSYSECVISSLLTLKINYERRNGNEKLRFERMDTGRDQI